MNINITSFEMKAHDAVRQFWRNREEARMKQRVSGKSDQGERAGVTAGNNMNAFLDLLMEIVKENGLPEADVYLNRAADLPGFYRYTKQWDMLVMNHERLIAAIELKSQVGPSFGNNFNNRTEEAIGTAVDLWTAYREGALGEQCRPFLGWMMMVEDCAKSRKNVRAASSHFAVFPEFNVTSYADRYHILCRKLMLERLYTNASVILSPRSAITTGEFTELSELTGLKTFVATLAGHVAAEAAILK